MHLALTALALGIALTALAPARPALAQAVVYVNTTEDSRIDTFEPCVPGGRCGLRSAIRTAQLEVAGAIVRACFDPAEVPGARACPPGAVPIRKSDPGYDPRIDRWVIKLADPNPIEMNVRQTFVDLRQGLDWKSPADNKFVIDASGLDIDHVFAMESDRNILAGFEIRGSFTRSAILIRGGRTRDESRFNQVGPGVIFANMPAGSGVHIVSKDTNQNRIIGNWCGITGDGTQVSPLTDDCVYLEQGTTKNVIGDASPGGRNIFAATSEGAGVRIEDSEFVGLDVRTRDNVIEYNWFGLDAAGEATEGLDSGLVLVWSPNNKVSHNVISNSRNAGVAVFNVLTGTLISDNIIGGGPDGSTCRGNKGDGVFMISGPSLSRIERNRVVCNAGNGVTLQGPNTVDNVISENSIRSVGGKPISLLSDANRKIKPPTLGDVSETSLTGTACAGCTVEVFSDNDRQAQYFEGRVVADASGAFVLDKPEGWQGRYVTASQARDGNGSELATAKLVGNIGRRTPTPTGAVPTWTPAVSETPGPSASPSPTPRPQLTYTHRIHLPILARGQADLGRAGVAVPSARQGADRSFELLRLARALFLR
ncbi:MAG: right-handed parallel beta-helix repeat-containing protein [Chloroflexi bacterium]|nr:right-handed parallel beta-helix repeat-containing protein [Chloroflexota bacterium]